MLKLGSGGCLDGPDFSPSSSPQSSAFLPGPSTAPRWYAEPHLISMETVLQPLEMPTPISFAKWFDHCTRIKSEKIGGSLIK